MSSQSPPRKRQKKGPQNILHSKPFRVDLSQLYNSQSFETIPTNHSIINKPPSSQPSQGISAVRTFRVYSWSFESKQGPRPVFRE